MPNRLRVTRENSRVYREEYSIDSDNDFPIRKMYYEYEVPESHEDMRIYGIDGWIFRARIMKGKIVCYDLRTRETMVAGEGETKIPEQLSQLEQTVADSISKRLSRRARAFFDTIMEKARE